MVKGEKNMLDEIIEKIENLSAIELSELAKKLEEKFGVQGMMAPVGVMNTGAAQASGGEEQKKEEKTTFDVILKNFGSNKIQAIKEVRAMTNLGLKEAKELIESLPKMIKEKVSKEEADEAKNKMTAIGAEVEIK
jgi:large subunit ribosomal protein L7/L12